MTTAASWVKFSKMHGLGNDFMVIALDSLDDCPSLKDPCTWRALAERHTGIGFDQALVILPATDSAFLACYRIFNADGGEVEQCGNGARCVAEWLRLNQRCSGHDAIKLQSAAGPIMARFLNPGQVAVNMGEPRFPAEPRHHLAINGMDVNFTMVSMGNPHIVIAVENVDRAPVKEIGPLLETHPLFPDRTNVGFAQRIDRGHLALRVHERGVGETKACGTGACAAVAAGRLAGELEAAVQVTLPGGSLHVEWPGPGEDLWLRGEAMLAYRGEVALA